MHRLLSAIFALLLSFSSFHATPEAEQPKTVTYIVNLNTDRFHAPDCSHADRIKEKNRWEYTGERELLIEYGYVPCKVCNP